MANTLTNLIPDFYEALDVVSREMTGFIPAVNRNSNVERAALNQSVRVPVTPTATSATSTPGVNAPDTGDQTIDNVEVTISKSEHVPVRFNGEETKGLLNAGTFGNIRADRFAQAIRALNNEMETDLWTETYQSSSRAFGTAGTAPFGTAGELDDFAEVAKILDYNGCPTGDRQLVLGHASIANLRGKQSVLFKVNEAGSSDMLRRGMTDRIQNFAIRHSHAVGVHTKGTGANWVSNATTTEPIGETVIAADGGTGTIIAGDIITQADDANNKYVVNTALSGGTFRIALPGLIEVDVDDGDAFTVGANYTANVAFDRNAVVLATRAPALPEGGDMAVDMATIVDPMTGIAYEIAHYKQYLQNVYHVRLAWGFKVVAERHVATLIG